MLAVDLSANNIGLFDGRISDHYDLSAMTLYQKYELFIDLLDTYDTIVLEDYAYKAGGKMTVIAETTGVFKLACESWQADLYLCNIQSWKKILPEGLPSKKKDSKRYIQETANLAGVDMDTDHQADAYWIWRWWQSRGE